MKRIVLLLLLFISTFFTNAQEVKRPRLMVGIMIDQMRWDYLYRYYQRYNDNGGFKRIMKHGYSCENTFIDYIPTITSCGHSAVYSGAPPAISGITGNFWWDHSLGRMVYCTEDKTVTTVGSTSLLGQMSPRNMFVSTITD